MLCKGRRCGGVSDIACLFVCMYVCMFDVPDSKKAPYTKSLPFLTVYLYLAMYQGEKKRNSELGIADPSQLPYSFPKSNWYPMFVIHDLSKSPPIFSRHKAQFLPSIISTITHPILSSSCSRTPNRSMISPHELQKQAGLRQGTPINS